MRANLVAMRIWAAAHRVGVRFEDLKRDPAVLERVIAQKMRRPAQPVAAREAYAVLLGYARALKPGAGDEDLENSPSEDAFVGRLSPAPLPPPAAQFAHWYFAQLDLGSTSRAPLPGELPREGLIHGTLVSNLETGRSLRLLANRQLQVTAPGREVRVPLTEEQHAKLSRLLNEQGWREATHEIEEKFGVNIDLLPPLAQLPFIKIRQGFLVVAPGRVAEARIRGAIRNGPSGLESPEVFTLTLKQGAGTCRGEAEIELTPGQAKLLFPIVGPRRCIWKVRVELGQFELDLYFGTRGTIANERVKRVTRANLELLLQDPEVRVICEIEHPNEQSWARFWEDGIPARPRWLGSYKAPRTD